MPSIVVAFVSVSNQPTVPVTLNVVEQENSPLVMSAVPVGYTDPEGGQANAARRIISAIPELS
jgi:Na+/H+-dicarboxylate symporter